ncbi:MAG: hypothetical protein AB8H86_15030 [Polyangiales bacterium]
MSGTRDRGQPSVDRPANQSIGALSILRRRLPHAVVAALMVLISIPLSIVLIGLLLFPLSTHFIVRSHLESAFDTKARGSFLAPLLILGLAFSAVLVGGGWFGLLEEGLYGHFSAAHRFTIALMSLPIPYAICAWVLTPVVYLIVLLVDIDAPKSLRHLVPLAVRVASEVPVRHRVLAVICSGAILLGPVVTSAYLLEGSYSATIQVSILMALSTIPLFVPVASALLVSSYSRVRHDLDSYQGHLPNFPPGLLVLTLVTFALSAFAAIMGMDQAGSLLLLVFSWVVILAALLGFFSAHRIRCLDPHKEGAGPGRRALEGTLERSAAKNTLVAGNLRFPIPQHALSDFVESGAAMTLVGDFAATTHALFRDHPEQEWPKGGTLHVSTLDALIRGRVRSATWVSYLALAAAGLIAIEMMTNIL